MSAKKAYVLFSLVCLCLALAIGGGAVLCKLEGLPLGILLIISAALVLCCIQGIVAAFTKTTPSQIVETAIIDLLARIF